MEHLVIHTDGAARGNPGPAAIGVAVYDRDRRPVVEISDFIGHTTNNVAEYRALVRGLEEALRLGAHKVEIYLDSELVVKHLSGEYKVKNAGLKPLFVRARELMASLTQVDVRHVPREKNKEADALANKALDRRHSAGA